MARSACEVRDRRQRIPLASKLYELLILTCVPTRHLFVALERVSVRCSNMSLAYVCVRNLPLILRGMPVALDPRIADNKSTYTEGRPCPFFEVESTFSVTGLGFRWDVDYTIFTVSA